MLEFNLFLIDYWYFSLPLLLIIFLFSYSEMNKGGKKIEPNELTTLINRENAILVDLRTKEDFDAGHIMSALNYPHQDFENQMHELDRYKERPIILVCDMGRNSANIGEKLKKADFKNTFRLNGGMMTWTQENLPVVQK